jgi:phosphate transport system protein
MARVATELLRQAVGALDELDASRVADAAAREAQLDTSLRGVLRSLISYMVEDPRTISSCLDYLFVAKSFERIGDHATNIFEHVIYAVRGENLRHAAPFSSQ